VVRMRCCSKSADAVHAKQDCLSVTSAYSDLLQTQFFMASELRSHHDTIGGCAKWGSEMDKGYGEPLPQWSAIIIPGTRDHLAIMSHRATSGH
jgi:hypothetical protein